MTTVSPNRETRLKQVLIVVLFSGTGMAAGFDLAHPVFPSLRRQDPITRAEQLVQRLWFYAPLGTAAGVASGLVAGYALRRATIGELALVFLLGGVILALGMLERAFQWWSVFGILAVVVGSLLLKLRRIS